VLSREATSQTIPARPYAFLRLRAQSAHSHRAPSLAQVNGQVALGLEVLATLLRVLEEQSQLLPPEAVGRLKQLQAQARPSGTQCSL